MSLSAMTWAIEAPISKPTAKLTLVCLADHASEAGECHPSQKRLAERVGVSERALRDALAWLEDQGFIERKQRRRSDGSRTSDSYQLPAEAYRQNFPHPRKKSTGSPAESAGLTTFEPVSEPSPSLRSGDARAPKGDERRRKIPDDWEPAAEARENYRSRGFTDAEIDHHADQMRSWAKGGGAKKIDWHQTFRNWIGKETPGRSPVSGYRKRSPPQSSNAFADISAEERRNGNGSDPGHHGSGRQIEASYTRRDSRSPSGAGCGLPPPEQGRG